MLATAWRYIRYGLLGLLAVASAFLGFGVWYYRKKALTAAEDAARERNRADMNLRLAKVMGDRARKAEDAARERGRIIAARDTALELARREAERAYAETDEYRARFAEMSSAEAWDEAFPKETDDETDQG